jgi:hypothetical protein
VHLGISRETLYAWSRDEDKSEFSDLLSQVRTAQERQLINEGLRGNFNSTITKLLLNKHGYSDKSEVTSVQPVEIRRIIVSPSGEVVT